MGGVEAKLIELSEKTTKVITNLLITGIEIMKRYKYMQRREQKQQICLIDFAGLHLIFIKENLMEGVG